MSLGAPCRASAPPATLFQAKAGSSAAPDSETEEQYNKAKKNLNVGTVVAVFGSAMLLYCLFLPVEANDQGNVSLTVSLLLSFYTFLSGNALMLLSLNMLGHREVLVSGGHRVAARCLIAACAVLSALTFLSLMALLLGGLHLYSGLAVVTVITLAAAGTHRCLRPRHGTEGCGEAEAASKIASCVTISAFGGLIGFLFSAPKICAVDAVDRAAIFVVFMTAILGMFVMTVSKITNQR